VQNKYKQIINKAWGFGFMLLEYNGAALSPYHCLQQFILTKNFMKL
jgi:hypothetical protein